MPGILGVPGGTLSKFGETLEQIPDTSLTTLAVSLSILGESFLKAVNPKMGEQTAQLETPQPVDKTTASWELQIRATRTLLHDLPA